MTIRFCEFCGSVSRDGATHCPKCGALLMREVSEEQFNDGTRDLPFDPVSVLCLRIQGQPRKIVFHGTQSVYHCWSRLQASFEDMKLYFRVRKDEMELVGGQCPPDFRLLEPGVLLNCKYRKFSFSFFEEADPELALEPGEKNLIYQCNFEIEDCPPKQWGNVLGWLVATVPNPRPEYDWTYDI